MRVSWEEGEFYRKGRFWWVLMGTSRGCLGDWGGGGGGAVDRTQAGDLLSARIT